MNQFTVPQFIDIESKIIGPITTRQFIMFIVGVVFIAISYQLFDFSLFLFVSVIIVCIVGIFAFLKINGRPFHYFVLNVVQTLKKPKLRVWNHKKMAAPIVEIKIIKQEEIIPQKEYFKKSRLAELSLIVDTQGKYKGEISDSEIKINNNQ